MKKINKKSSENDQLTGHFQSLFFFFVIFRAFFFFNISRKNSKTSRANQQSVLNFPKNLDRTITFYSVTLKNTQTEPQRNIIFFIKTNNI